MFPAVNLPATAATVPPLTCRGAAVLAASADQQRRTWLSASEIVGETRQVEPPAWASRQLAVVVPTLNESANVPVLVGRLHEVLRGIEWEVVFVDDDSRDGTADVARRIAQADPRVRCLQRIGRRGLSS